MRQSVTRFMSGAFLALGLALGLATSALAQGPAHEIRPNDNVIGSEDADFVIFEYASFACPHCAHFQESVWPTVKSDFIDSGEVRWVFRPMLTNPVPIAGAGTILANCAADDRFFDAADLLFAEQTAIFDAARSGGDVLAVYYRIGAAVGLSEEELMGCFQDPAMNEAVNQAAYQAGEDGMAGTPSFIIGGEILRIQHGPDGNFWYWASEPLMINGERVPAQFDGDSFSRIILHFLNASRREQ